MVYNDCVRYVFDDFDMYLSADIVQNLSLSRMGALGFLS